MSDLLVSHELQEVDIVLPKPGLREVVRGEVGKRDAEEVMNDWSSDMQKLLGHVEKAWMDMNAAQAAQSRVKAQAAASS